MKFLSFLLLLPLLSFSQNERQVYKDSANNFQFSFSNEWGETFIMNTIKALRIKDKKGSESSWFSIGLLDSNEHKKSITIQELKLQTEERIENAKSNGNIISSEPVAVVNILGKEWVVSSVVNGYNDNTTVSRVTWQTLHNSASYVLTFGAFIKEDFIKYKASAYDIVNSFSFSENGKTIKEKPKSDIKQEEVTKLNEKEYGTDRVKKEWIATSNSKGFTWFSWEEAPLAIKELARFLNDPYDLPGDSGVLAKSIQNEIEVCGYSCVNVAVTDLNNDNVIGLIVEMPGGTGGSNVIVYENGGLQNLHLLGFKPRPGSDGVVIESGSTMGKIGNPKLIKLNKNINCRYKSISEIPEEFKPFLNKTSKIYDNTDNYSLPKERDNEEIQNDIERINLNAYGKNVVRRRSKDLLEMKLTNGKIISFKNNYDDENYRKFRYAGSIYPTSVHVFSIDGYETTSFLVVDKTNGVRQSVRGRPIESTDKKRFICFTSGEDDSQYYDNYIAIWLFSNGKFIKEFESKGMDWGPSSAIWKSNTEIVIGAEKYDGTNANKLPERKLVFLNGKWLLR